LQTKRLANALFAQAARVQTQKLITYAEQEIERIGDSMAVCPTTNQLDRTGNLLDSVCWLLCYEGRLQKFGYYRPATAIEDSHLHEYSKPMGMSVNGHHMAQQFIATYKATSTKGWELVFAVVAPYWGYWEKGFTHRRSGHRFQWQVMTQQYDQVRSDLTPSRVSFHNYIPAA